MREITTHKVNEVNDGLILQAVDDRGPAGANHAYSVTLPAATANDDLGRTFYIDFQNGPIWGGWRQETIRNWAGLAIGRTEVLV